MTTQIADLVGLTEIAEKLGVSKNVASGWTRKHDFPRPKHKLAMGPMWDWNEVSSYLEVPTRLTVSDETGKLTLEVKRGSCPYCGDSASPIAGSLFLGWSKDLGVGIRYGWQCDFNGEHNGIAPVHLSKEDA